MVNVPIYVVYVPVTIEVAKAHGKRVTPCHVLLNAEDTGSIVEVGFVKLCGIPPLPEIVSNQKIEITISVKI